MNLPRFPVNFALNDLWKLLPEALRALERADKDNRKATADIELTSGQRLIMTDTTTGDRVAITLDSGALTFTTL